METPSDSESLHFPNCDLDLEGERPEVKHVFINSKSLFSVFKTSQASLDCFPDDLRRLGVASNHRRAVGPRSGSHTASLPGEDMVDSKGTRWRCFSTGDPTQESQVNMSVLEPFLRVLSHGGTSSNPHTG